MVVTWTVSSPEGAIVSGEVTSHELSAAVVIAIGEALNDMSGMKIGIPPLTIELEITN